MFTESTNLHLYIYVTMCEDDLVRKTTWGNDREVSTSMPSSGGSSTTPMALSITIDLSNGHGPLTGTQLTMPNCQKLDPLTINWSKVWQCTLLQPVETCPTWQRLAVELVLGSIEGFVALEIRRLAVEGTLRRPGIRRRCSMQKMSIWEIFVIDIWYIYIYVIHSYIRIYIVYLNSLSFLL